MKNIFCKLHKLPWLDKVLSLLAGILYFLQAFIFAHTLGGTMDEGTYLMKGLLYVRGVYKPFQLYGPWTNKMPLAFLIPGWVQDLFEPGLRTGRYFSVFLALLALLGLWLLTRRLTGRWWAAMAVWIMAINSGNIMYYCTAVSQVLVACLLTWSLVFALGKGRKRWEIVVSTILAVMILFTRQNMAPYLALLVLYIAWEHGWRNGLLSLGVAAALVVGGHAYYWPDIMRIWAHYLPGWVNALIPTTPSSGSSGESVQVLGWSLDSKILVFWEGIRSNFIALMGSVLCWVLWPKKQAWHSRSQFIVSVFLSVALLVLTGIHFYAAFFLNYCLYCYTGYLAFFNMIGLLLVFNTLPSLNWRMNTLQRWVVMLVVLVSTTGIAYSSHQVFQDLLLNIQVPRMRNMQFLPGTIELWRFLNNKFGWERELLGKVIPTLAGFALGLLFLLISWLVARKGKRLALSAAHYALICFFGIGWLLMPTPILGGYTRENICGWDVIASYEKVGAHLKNNIEPGSLIYWENDLAPTPLLYIADMRIYPPQLNHWYNYYIGGDSDNLLKFGSWNDELAARWRQEADYLLISDRYVNRLANRVDMRLYDELPPTEQTIPCESKSIIHIFKNKQ